ncbi:MAG: hypothetical protein JOZ02_23825 [Acidobacteria bacterium]|nr:hypothetical protein [Acidobacteriota bacterium]
MRESCRRVKGRVFTCLACLLVCAFAGVSANAEPSAPRIVCRATLAEARRTELAAQLRAITGWAGLHFDGEGFLRFGSAGPAGGSQSARELLAAAEAGENLLIIEDASGSADVVFSRVLEGRWKGGSGGRPPAYVIQIDFKDFSHVMGDRAALAAFNAGWGALHEIEHAVNDSADAQRPGDSGACEAAINRMRRECGLAERAEYFYTPVPGAERGDFKTRYVRLAFTQARPSDKRRRQYWLYWDAALTGVGADAGQVASR